MKILTFDIEEWFHILDNQSTKTDNEWLNYESRIHSNMDRLLSLLDKHKQKATFFCLGWIAAQYPEIVKEIHKRGFEIGSHTHMHQLIYEQQPKEFENDVERSIKTIEDLLGCQVKYFRAPGFSITEQNKWAFEILFKHGIKLDCSVFPAHRAHGGFPSYKKSIPSILKYNGIKLKELPINYINILGRPVIYSGGGYFRLFPYSLIKRWTNNSSYVMSYLHPRDFDPNQPMIQDLPRFRKFKSYYGVKGAIRKLENWITDFEFIDIQTANKIIDWTNVPEIDIT